MPPPHGTVQEARDYSGIGAGGPPGGGDPGMTYTAPSQPSGGDGLIDPGFHPALATIQDQALKDALIASRCGLW